MARPAGPARELSRRGFLGLASAAAGFWAGGAWARALGDVAPATDGDHAPSLRLPGTTRNGAKVPVVVEMSHPMTPAHHVTTIEVVNRTDPIPLKGTFHFTPASGAAYVAFQARMDGGDSEVTATAECNRHGQSSVRRRIHIPEDAGGCAGTVPPPAPSANDFHAPEIRIAELVRTGRIGRGEVIHPQLKIRHPNRTGLVKGVGGSLELASEPLYLEVLEVRFCGELASRFELGPALSDDPFFTFALRASREGPLEVRLVNSRGERFEALHEIRFS